VHVFEDILNQNRPIRLLTTLFNNKTIPHALLFTGVKGVGKKRCSIAFAMLCNCTDLRFLSGTDNEPRVNPCGHCSSCKKIKSGNHPDIIIVEPSGTYIRIDQIRNLCRLLALRPHEAHLRVVIISDAQALTTEAGNALLKELEEPPSGTLFILTAPQKSDLLPTVLSRSQVIGFNPFSLNDLISILKSRHGANHNDALIMAAMAGGSLSTAITMWKSKNRIDFIHQRKWLINFVNNCIISEPSPDMLFASALRLAKNKEFFLDSLKVIKSWLRDLVIYKYSPEKIFNKDMTNEVKEISENIAEEPLLCGIKVVDNAQKKILANSALRLTAEIMIIKLARV